MAIGNYLTTADVARLLGVTTGRVRHFVYDNRLRVAKKIGMVLFFDAAEVAKFAEKERTSGRPKKS